MRPKKSTEMPSKSVLKKEAFVRFPNDRFPLRKKEMGNDEKREGLKTPSLYSSSPFPAAHGNAGKRWETQETQTILLCPGSVRFPVRFVPLVSG
jgi:hypothetical protein